MGHVPVALPWGAAVMDVGHTYKVKLTLLLNTRGNTDTLKRTNPP